MPVKHARYSPSKLTSTEKCPCFDSDNSARKQRDLEAADEGTLLHSALEINNPATLETEEQLWAFDSCKKKIQGIIDGCSGKSRVLLEQRLVVKGLTYGYADVVILDYARKEIHVCDYKLGRTAVDHAEVNLQLHAYGVGALERWRSFHTVHLHIIAPRIPDFTKATFSRDLIETTRSRILNIISTAASPFKQPNGGEHCSFCTNKPRCPVMNQAAVDVTAGAGFFDLPKNFLPANIVSPEDRAKSLVLARVLPDWCTLIKQMNTTAVLEYGEEIPGFSLRRRTGSVSIKDQTYVFEKLREKFNWSAEEFIYSGAAKLSISKIADMMEADFPVEGFTTKRDYTDALVEMLGDSTSRGEEVVFLQKDRKPTDQELLDIVTQRSNE